MPIILAHHTGIVPSDVSLKTDLFLDEQFSNVVKHLFGVLANTIVRAVKQRHVEDIIIVFVIIDILVLVIMLDNINRTFP